MIDYFISYTRSDLEWAEWCARVLNQEGYKTWYQERDSVPGEWYGPAIIEKCSQAGSVIALLSPEYFESEWAVRELFVGVESSKLIPIRLREFTSRLFPPIDYINICGLDKAAARRALLDGLRKKRLEANPSVHRPSWEPAPAASNPFEGREDELNSLKVLLSDRQMADGQPARVVALIGGEGVGKTQLARSFCHRSAEEFPGGVFWLDFSKAEGISAEIAKYIDPPRSEADLTPSSLRLQIERIRRSWESRDRSLLVFDNCSDKKLLSRYCPPKGVSRVLLTSRRRDWDEFGVQVVTLGRLRRSESVSLLRRFCPDQADDSPALESIAERLGDLPLALRFAGLALAQRRHTRSGGPRAYLKLLIERVPKDRSDPLSHALEVSYETLPTINEGSGPVDVALLSRAACFAAAKPIPIPLLVKTIQGLPDAVGRAQEGSLHRLVESGWLDRINGSVTMQAPVRDFLQRQSGVEEARIDVERMILRESRRLIPAKEIGERRSGDQSPRLMLGLQPHLLAAAEESDEAGERSADLCDFVGHHLSDLNDFESALRFREKALRIRSDALGPEHPDTASSLANLGSLFQLWGRYDQAWEYHQRALEIRMQFPEEGLKIAQSQDSLGKVARRQERFETSIEFHLKALKIRESITGRENREVAESLHDLGVVSQGQRLLDDARRYHLEALTVRNSVFGKDHLETVRSTFRLGEVALFQKDYALAEICMMRALDIRKKELNQDHSEIAQVLHGLGLLYKKQRRFEDAQDKYEEALAIREYLEPEHPHVASICQDLGTLFKDQGDYDRARHFLERSLAIRDKLGPKSPALARSLESLGSLLQAQAEYRSAEELIQRSHSIRREVLEPEHIDIAKSEAWLGLLCEKQGRQSEAIRHYNEALRIYRSKLRPDHSYVANIAAHLKRLLKEDLGMSPGNSADERYVPNGIDGSTGLYIPLPRDDEEHASILCEGPPHPLLIRERRWWVERHGIDDPDRSAVQGVDPLQLSSAGWGVIFAPDVEAGVKEALQPLLNHRKAQASAEGREDYYQEYDLKKGFSKQSFLDHQKVPPGPADPESMPYYLLIVGDPRSIPFRFQSELDVQYAVGRIHFDHPEDYGRYAQAVISAETGDGPVAGRDVTFFSVENPDDRATRRTAIKLIEPLAAKLGQDRPHSSVDVVRGGEADKRRLTRVLGGAETSGLLVTASHGMHFPYGDARQREAQGALLCQDWPGPKTWRASVPEDHYFSAADLPEEAQLTGLIALLFAYCSAGTPERDCFDFEGGGRPQRISRLPFVSSLSKALLSHPKGGAQAVLGHIGRTFTTSFSWSKEGQVLLFENVLKRLLDGHPVGSAMEYINQRHAEASVQLGEFWMDQEQLAQNPPTRSAFERVWRANNDARNFIVIGDPAVRLTSRDNRAGRTKDGELLDNCFQ